MHTPSTSFDLQTIAARWQAFDSVAHVHPIRSPEDYERMVALMDSILAATGDDEDHPLSSLLDLVGDVVEKYEREHYAIEAASPKDALRFLMDERGLKQEDLAPLIHQSNLSAILAGKRKINATLAAKLGKFFGISAAVFVSV